MRTTSGSCWQVIPSNLLAHSIIVAGLVFFAAQAEARPRGPFPPVPEAGVIYHQDFDWLPYSATNAHFFIPGVGTIAESWAGFALERAGATVPPWTVPALDASGHTNLACATAGALRFYFAPHFSSASIQGGIGPGAPAHLADLVASSAAGSAPVFSLQVSADGNLLQLLDYSGSSPVQLLSAPIVWQARQNHLARIYHDPHEMPTVRSADLQSASGAR